MICDYGCSEEAIHQFKNGKWCCCERCHYEKGHIGNCSTGKLAKMNCNTMRD